MKIILVLLSTGLTVIMNQSICKRRTLVTKTYVETFYYTYFENQERNCYMGLIKCYDKEYRQDLNWRLAKKNVWLYKDVCCPGYIRDKAKSTDEKLVCVAVCRSGCLNGACVIPDSCECFPGFYPYSSHECRPLCAGCDFGKCIAPNVCECNSGYILEDSICKPFCKGCSNGKCVQPNKCECDSGYELDSSGDCTEKRDILCGEGYKLVDGRCEAMCRSCNYGICLGPGECKCNAGYMKTLDLCVPFCENGCPNGECIEPNICKCNKGYAFTLGICTPLCDDCVFGECVEVDVCHCLKGFEKNASGICSPQCDFGCPANSYCMAPDLCHCTFGYEMFNGKCTPVCDNCKNGMCIGPGFCQCLPGYERDYYNGGSCKRVCGHCRGGVCLESGVCMCAHGQYYDKNSEQNCIEIRTTSLSISDTEEVFTKHHVQREPSEDLILSVGVMLAILGLLIISVTIYLYKTGQSNVEGTPPTSCRISKKKRLYVTEL